jgi:hypothetical protein
VEAHIDFGGQALPFRWRRPAYSAEKRGFLKSLAKRRRLFEKNEK